MMNLEELVETRDEWRGIQARLQQAVGSMDEALAEMTSIMNIKHRRLSRQLKSMDDKPEGLALPVKIEPVTEELPPGKRRAGAATSSSSTTAAPMIKGSLGMAKRECS